MKIIEIFLIAERGVVVAVDETTELPAGQKLLAVIRRPSGDSISVDAYKERLLRKTPQPIEGEAFLLVGLSKSDVPLGTDLQLRLSATES